MYKGDYKGRVQRKCTLLARHIPVPNKIGISVNEEETRMAIG